MKQWESDLTAHVNIVEEGYISNHSIIYLKNKERRNLVKKSINIVKRSDNLCDSQYINMNKMN